MKPVELADAIGIDVSELEDAVRSLENKGILSTSMRSHFPGVPYITLTKNYRSDSTTTTIQAPNELKQATPILGMGDMGQVEPRVHFLEAVAEVKDVFTHQDLSFPVDSATVELVFGQKRQKVSLTINQNKPGLDYDQYRNVLNKAWVPIEQKLGRKVAESEFEVVNAHFNFGDFLGLKLEGLNALTLLDHSNWLARLYNKAGSLRSEGVSTSGSMTLDQASAFMMRSLESQQMIRDTHEKACDILGLISNQPTQDRNWFRRVLRKPRGTKAP